MGTVAPLGPDDPTAVGPYRLVGRLGEGGQGVVYLGQADNGPPVAVKVLRDGLGGDDRFAKEIAAARRVEPFCIAQVLDASLGDGPGPGRRYRPGQGSPARGYGRPYIVTEYVEGPSLHEAGLHGGADLQRLAVATATALAAIHEAGVVHRDFKPANVLLGPGGPRVIDFGIARATDAAATATSGIVGTPAYMAPEQLAGHDVGPAADVFAWASVIVFAATGTPPFGSDTLPAIINRILHNEPQLGDLPRQLRGVVYDCLAKNPAARPRMREVLLRLLGGDQRPAPDAQNPAQGYAGPDWNHAGPTPGHAGPTPGHAGSPHGRTGSAPGHGGPAWDRAGSAPGHAGPSWDRAGSGPGHAGPAWERAGSTPGYAQGGPVTDPGVRRDQDTDRVRRRKPVRAALVVPLAVAGSVVVAGGLVSGLTWLGGGSGLWAAAAPYTSTPTATGGKTPRPAKTTRKPTPKKTSKQTPKPKPSNERTTQSPTPTQERATPTPTPTRTTKKPAPAAARVRVLGIDLHGGPGQDHTASCYMPPVGFSGSLESSRSEVWISYAWVVDGQVKHSNRTWVPKGEFTAPALAHQYMLKTGGHNVTLKVTAPGSAARSLPFSVCSMED
ncbi:serine/threonine protein kinase [Nonomuraea endophytica]|uniref:serine/threonine protein kinase n=1 Tax=Nonomuraea endophytica TaxID=714136 RepID=UPI0037C6D550